MWKVESGNSVLDYPIDSRPVADVEPTIRSRRNVDHSTRSSGENDLFFHDRGNRIVDPEPPKPPIPIARHEQIARELGKLRAGVKANAGRSEDRIKPPD